jgi:hypothetical protein
MSFPPATIQLDPTLHELLVLLASRLGKEKGEVLSRALSLYNYLVEESRANDIVLRDRNSKEERRLDLGVTQPDQGTTSS